METSEIIRKLCKSRGMSVTDLEAQLGYGNGSLTKKDTAIRSDRLLGVAKFFGVKMEYLMGGEESEEYYISNETAKKAQELFENKDMRILFDAADGSRPENLQMAADLLNRLKATNPEG